MEQQIDELRGDIDMLRSLQEHAGYRWFMSKVDQVAVTKMTEIAKAPAESFPEQARTYVAGELRALRYCRDAVQSGIDNMASSLRALEMRAEDTE